MLGLSHRMFHQTVAAEAARSGATSEVANKKQQGLLPWLWDQVLHIWHGFRLLAVDTRVAMRLKRRVFSGQKLTRRETQLLERTTRDLLRMVPFSFFVLLPGGELLLPIALAMFPNMIPSTFVTAEKLRMKRLLHKLDTGASRRRLLEHMTSAILWYGDWDSASRSLAIARDMMQGSALSEESIRTFVPYFKPSGPLALEKMPDYIMRDLTKLSSTFSHFEHWVLPKSWHSVRMRFVFARRLEEFERDDDCLANAGVEMLTRAELEKECAKRRMHFVLPTEALRQQLKQWLSLSLDPDVPNHMLLFLAPIAASSEAVMESLTKEERDHILGLERYQDGMLYQLLHRLTKQASKDAQTLKKEKVKDDMMSSVMQDDLEELKQRIADTSQEAYATEVLLADAKAAFRDVSDEELLKLFETVTSTDAGTTLPDGTLAANTRYLGRALVEFCRSRPNGLGGCTEERLFELFVDFDGDRDGVVSRDEFLGEVNRMRG